MTDILLSIAMILLVVTGGFLLLRKREPLDPNVGMRYRNLNGLLLGVAASLLPLTNGTWSTRGATWAFVGALGVTLVLLAYFRPKVEDRFAWDLLVVIVLGFGLGTLLFQSRSWWIYLWQQYLLNILFNSLFNIRLSILVLVLIGGFLWWIKRGTSSIEKLRESLFRNVGVPYRNLIGLLLGVTASLLPLTSGTWSISWATWIFVGALAITMILLVAARPKVEKELDRFAWGLLVIIVLGFGLGALIFQSRSWWIWLWQHYLRINNTGAILLEALFLLGVILGFFVVRNWAKEQKDFVTSLSAVLSGAFLATVLGKLQEGNPPAISPMDAFAYYALGFTISGSLNLIAAARLTANYVNKRSITSRAILDFLYGSERAKIIDGYFLKNFEDDKDYAKQRMTDTLIEFSRLVQREFAERLEERRKIREKNTPPSYFYELIAIECEDQESTAKTQVQDEPEYIVVCKRIGSLIAQKIEGSMFRVGVSARWQDALEYITAPGEYRAPFPFQGSVAGLALLFRQTIVMNRDTNKRFRNKQYTEGICPKEIQQNRGLDIIDYLSYVAIPIVSSHGSPTENTLGVLTIDAKLFVTPLELAGKPVRGAEGLLSLRMTKTQLIEYANNLYDREDKDVKYIEDLTKIVTPILELYAKCRVGAT